ncbi:MAG: DUF1080 domain-containing protein [Planctomycetes bacterium]|nr:DUF1080 domain-containing protein [Planctomycetota bacterium]
MKMTRLWVACGCALICHAAGAAETIFIPVKVDGPVHDPARHSYWYGPFSECASVLDVDGDGDLDIACGRNWYEAPDWIKHENFRPGAATNGPETDNNSEFAMDVNFDGRMDIVSSGWMFMKGAFWYENPGNKTDVWKSYRIHTALNMEGVIHGDIDGDGDDDVLCNHWAPVPGQGVTWLEHIDRPPWFVGHVVGTHGDFHGNGLGDINGDGRMDIVTPVGWYEQPERATDKPWPFHADYKFEPAKHRGGGASHPILVHDVNEDGLNDVIIGSSHAYGLAWLEQSLAADGKRSFTTRWMDTEYSQVHTLALGDLNGDGKADLVTGKRLFAHHGHDIGAGEPLYAFWYDLRRGDTERHVLSFNHPRHYPGEKINPPPNYVVSVGMKLNIADMDKDGRNDIVIAGKGGLYIFYNHGAPPTAPIPDALPPHDSYPTWRDWTKYQVLFNGKDLTGWLTGPDNAWIVEDGTLTPQRELDGREHNFDYLWTEKTYGDFVLDFEFMVVEGSNSGVFLRTGDLRDPVHTGIEVQICSSFGREGLSNKGTAGAIYDCQAPTQNAVKPPGQWNHCEITCQGPRIRVILNGQTVNEIDVDRWDTAGKNPDGTPNKFKIALKDFPRTGHIGFQDHGRKIWYRSVWIRPITK